MSYFGSPDPYFELSVPTNAFYYRYVIIGFESNRFFFFFSIEADGPSLGDLCLER